VAISVNTGIVHLPLGERPRYGSPYPEGIAVGHQDITGDASGGTIVNAFLADGGFLYRLELVNVTQSTANTNSVHIIQSSRWATDKSGLGAAAFDLNWHLIQVGRDGFSVYTPENQNMGMMRRMIMGRTDTVDLQTVASYHIGSNVDTVVWDMDIVLTYWRKESLSLPGFLSSFYEAPAVPPLVPPTDAFTFR